MSDLGKMLDAVESPRDRIKRLREERKKKNDLSSMLDAAGVDEVAKVETPGEEVELDPEKQAVIASVFGKAPGAPKKKEEGPGFVEGIVRGVREEIAPFSYSEEEIEKRKAEDVSGAGIAGEVVGGITGSIAATAAAAKTGSVIGGFLAGPAAPLGSIIGAGVGAIGYALYTGFGQERLQAAVTDQETSTARAVARSALALNPAARLTGRAASVLGRTAPKLVKAAESKAALVARGAAQVAGETAVAGSTYGSEAAVAAGAASLILSPLVFGRVKGAPTPAEVKSFEDLMSTEEGMNIIERRADKFKEISKMKVSSENLKEDDFITYVLGMPNMPGSGGRVFKLTREQRKKAFRESLVRMDVEGNLIGGLKREALPEMYRGYKAQQTLIEAVKEANIDQSKKIAEAFTSGKKAPEIDAFHDAFKWWADGQYIARAIDRVAGTNYTTQLNRLAEVNNQFEVTKAGLQRLAVKAQKEERKLIKGLNKKLGKNQGEVTQNLARLRVFISENDERFLTPELRELVNIKTRTLKTDTPEGAMVQKAMEKWDDFFETARIEANKTEFFVPKVDGYVTRKTLSSVDLITNIRRSVQQLKAYATSAGVDDIFKLTTDDLAKIGRSADEAKALVDEVDSLRYISRTKLGIDKADITEVTLGATIKDLLTNGKARLGLGSEIGAAMQRGEANIAPRFRNLNMSELAMSYIDGTVRNATFSQIYRELSDSLDALRLAGMPKAVEWMQTHLDDTIGGTVSGNMKVSNLLQSSVDKYKLEVIQFFENKGLQDSFLEKAALYIPDLLAKSRAMIYPSYLAGNLKAHIRDYGQVLLKAAPELGGWYGTKTALKSYASVLRMGRDGNGKFSMGLLRKKLQDAGVVGEFNITAEAVRAEMPSAGKLTGAYRQISEGAMALYGMGDFVNRAVTYNMGKEFAKDLVAKDPAALKALGNLGKSAMSNLKAAGFREAVEAGDVAKLGDIMGRWLVPKTQFYYGAAQKSQFARFLGPTFSMFTKWPTSITSELVDIWKENPDAYRRLRRYYQIHLAPLGLLTSIDYVRNNYFDGDEEGAYNYLIGTTREMAPAYSLEFTVFQNPTIDLANYAATAVKEVASDFSGEGAQRAAAKVAKKVSKQTLGPISAIINETERVQERLMGKKKTTIDEAFNSVFGVDK
jgi:hypothetical protein